jgi:alpha-ketoglutarate-dependent taurine dioxygenase
VRHCGYRRPHLHTIVMRMSANSKPTAGFGGPFDLADEGAYQAWRAHKLADYPTCPADLMVDVEDPFRLSGREAEAILARCRKANMALYRLRGKQHTDKALVRALGRQFGLHRLDNNLCADNDNVTSLRVMEAGRHTGYIPYTDRRLNWHTDGYYNLAGHQIRAIVMHCVSDAESGGESLLLDHELAYILLRDEDPRMVAALMAPDVMTIPPNVEGGVELRPAQTGPVFSVDSRAANLHMRYTARTRSIHWKTDGATRAAVQFLDELFTDGSSPYIFRHRLAPGQGVICNNVVHGRTAFKDDPTDGHRRLLYRTRYYDRIRGTDLRDHYPEAYPHALAE